MLDTGGTIKLKAWKAETIVLVQKKTVYSEMHLLKQEVQEAEVVRKCMEQAISRSLQKHRPSSER